MKIHEGDNNAENQLLNYYSLRENTMEQKIAMVHRVSESRTETEKTFFKIILKDCNGNKITSRLFNPDNLEDSNSILKAMEGKVVNVEFEVQRFQGELQLVIKNIELLLEEYQELASAFSGTVDSLTSLPDQILSRFIDNDLATYIKTSQLLTKIQNKSLEAYSNKVGSKLQHMLVMLNHLTLHDLTPNEQLMYLLVEAHIYDAELSDESALNNGKLKNTRILEGTLLKLKPILPYGDNLYDLALHLAQVRLGIEAPITLSEHIIVKCDEDIKSVQKLRNEFEAMLKDSYRITDEGKLIKRTLEG